MQKTKLEKAIDAICYTFNNLIGKIKAHGKFDKNLWLISERGFDAQDNGYQFYKYLINNKDMRNITPVYVISADSDDYEKVAALGGRIVEPGTSEHYQLMYQAGALISTHTYGFTPDMQVYYKLAKWFMFHPRGVNVFLQHGISDKDEQWLYRENYKPDIFIVSAEIEKNEVINRFGQPEEVVKNIGLCRYDSLLSSTTPVKKQILIMPTWREWLRDLSKTDFVQSEYCQKWRSILFDKSLIFRLSKQGYNIVFYLHPELQEYADLFTHDGITVKTNGIHELIMESEILVTDYSSVYFDMAYLDRNIIFFQFDKKRYATEHYQGLFIDHSKFGYVGKKSDEVKQAIKATVGVDNAPVQYGDEIYKAHFFGTKHVYHCLHLYYSITCGIRKKGM